MNLVYDKVEMIIDGLTYDSKKILEYLSNNMEYITEEKYDPYMNGLGILENSNVYNFISELFSLLNFQLENKELMNSEILLYSHGKVKAQTNPSQIRRIFEYIIDLYPEITYRVGSTIHLFLLENQHIDEDLTIYYINQKKEETCCKNTIRNHRFFQVREKFHDPILVTGDYSSITVVENGTEINDENISSIRINPTKIWDHI